MPGVEQIGQLLLPYSGQRLSSEALGLFQSYLALIMKWNSKFNLTAIRDPEQIVTRHFGEGVFAAQFVPEVRGSEPQISTLVNFSCCCANAGSTPMFWSEIAESAIAITVNTIFV